MCKYAFIWHFALGFFALSNNQILTSEDKDFAGSVSAINSVSEAWFGEQLFESERYMTGHIQLFLIINGVMLCIIFLDIAIVECFAARCKQLCSCFLQLKKNINANELVSDDYYDLLDLKFIINEYRRAKVEILQY